MKRYFYSTVIAGGLLAAMPLVALDKDAPKTNESMGQRVVQGTKNILEADPRFEDLPAAVQKTVREQIGSSKITDIDREDRTGRTIYEVQFDRDGKSQKLYVTGDGKEVSEKDASLFGNSSDRAENEKAHFGPNLKDLPAAAQKTIKEQARGDMIEDIDRTTVDGKHAYRVEFERKGAGDREICVNEEGQILKSK